MPEREGGEGGERGEGRVEYRAALLLSLMLMSQAVLMMLTDARDFNSGQSWVWLDGPEVVFRSRSRTGNGN